MYIWIGCKLPTEFETDLRSRCEELNKEILLNTDAFSLPQHVSLKISFQSEAYQEIIKALSAFLRQQPRFSLVIREAEQMGHILWLPVEENNRLRQLHEQLDTLLQQRFQIPQHEFDKCFQFHSTLFLDTDTDKVTRMCQLLQGFPAPIELLIDTFLLGISETGKPGQFRIVEEIKV